MKRIALTLLPVLGLVGCGTLPAPSVSATAQSEVSTDGIDYAKMARFDHVARQRGIQLVWVNPPRLKVTATSGG